MPKHALVIFPYLKTSEPFVYQHLAFYPSIAIPDEHGAASEDISLTTRMFFLRDGFRIRSLTYAIIQLSDGEVEDEDLKAVNELRALLAYLYSSPHRTFGNTFLSSDHSSAFIFKPKPVSVHLLKDDKLCEPIEDFGYPDPDKRGEIPGYEVVRDQKSIMWVAPGSRIYPPTRSFQLNLSQDIAVDLKRATNRDWRQSLVSIFDQGFLSDDLRQRIFTALSWYNRANAIDIEDDVALINLAVAFEALLSLEQGPRLTDRFRQAVSVLISGVPRLDSWLVQFYKARSIIVHTGRIEDLRFMAVDTPKKEAASVKRYRSLVADGRQVFQLSLETILYGAKMASDIRLSSKLYTNQERFEEICKILSTESLSVDHRFEAIRSNVEDASRYRFIGETGLKLETLVSASRLISDSFLEGGYKSPAELVTLIADLSTSPKDDEYFMALTAISKIHEFHTTEYEKWEKDNMYIDELKTLLVLIDVVWNYTFLHFYWISRGDP